MTENPEERPTERQINYAYDLTKIPRDQLRKMTRGEVGELIDRALREEKPDEFLVGYTHDLTGIPPQQLGKMTKPQIFDLLGSKIWPWRTLAQRDNAIKRAIWEKKFPVGSRIQWSGEGRDVNDGKIALVLGIYPTLAQVRWEKSGRMYIATTPSLWELVEPPTEKSLALIKEWEESASGWLNLLAQKTALPHDILRGLNSKEIWLIKNELKQKPEMIRDMKRQLPVRTKVRSTDAASPRLGQIGIVVTHDRNYVRVIVRWPDLQETSHPFPLTDIQKMSSAPETWEQFPPGTKIRKIFGTPDHLGQSATVIAAGSASVGAFIQWQDGSRHGCAFQADDFVALPPGSPDYPPSHPVRLSPTPQELREERRKKFLALLGKDLP